jgi:hypothetical protein
MTDDTPLRRLTVFDGDRQIAAGTDPEIVARLGERLLASGLSPLVIIDDASGRSIDIDLRPSPPAPERDGRGRPRLGVVAREVTLLPRQWEWLAGQRGGASVALRRLVDEARRASTDADRQRGARDAAYHAMSTLCGDLPGFEEASRALFSGDLDALRDRIAGWPGDVTAYLLRLLQPSAEA